MMTPNYSLLEKIIFKNEVNKEVSAKHDDATRLHYLILGGIENDVLKSMN